MKQIIQTVCGDIPPGTLGFCHSHEHLMLAKCRGAELHSALCMDDPQKSLEELILFAKVGGGAVVDAQPLGCGRMSAELQELSAKSGVHIVASTGFHKMVFYYDGHWVFSYDAEKLASVFVHELQKGMFTDTERGEPRAFHEAKAGVIKTALDTANLDAQYAKLFSAAAKAHTETGAPLLIHVESGSDPLALDDFLDSHGVAASKRIYCHLDRAAADLKIHAALLKRGCYLEYDTINRLKYHDNDTEAAILLAQLAAGFQKQILLGLDTTNQRLKAYGGDMGLDFIQTDFIPLLKAKGVSESAITDMMVTNPSNAFAITR